MDIRVGPTGGDHGGPVDRKGQYRDGRLTDLTVLQCVPNAITVRNMLRLHGVKIV